MIAQPPIEEIVRTIVNSVHPRRVVLFGSYARGDARPNSDVDLMVEIDDEPNPRQRESAIRDLLRGSPWEVDAKVYSAAGVERLRDDPGTLIYSIAREGRVLYVRPGESDALRGFVREQLSPPESLDWWMRAAEEDVLGVLLLQQGARVPWSLVCFHAQQAAEKYLKALLIQRHRNVERTHDLERVLTACRAAAYDLPGLDADCRLLSAFSVRARYPDDHGPSQWPLAPDGLAASSACRRIVEACMRFLPVSAS